MASTEFIPKITESFFYMQNTKYNKYLIFSLEQANDEKLSEKNAEGKFDIFFRLFTPLLSNLIHNSQRIKYNLQFVIN